MPHINRKNRMNTQNSEGRILGRTLSLDELDLVSGGMEVITCTPADDGCADEDGNDVEC